MASKELMNWQGDRWDKQHGGKRVLVGPRALRKEFPTLFRSNTREGSREAANAWWEKFQSNLPAAPKPHAKRIAYLRKVAAANDLLGAGQGDPVRQIILTYENDPKEGKRLDQELFSFPSESSLNARLQIIEAQQVDVQNDMQLATLAGKFLAVKKAKSQAGKMEASSWETLRHQLQHFRKFYGDDGDCSKINETTVEKFFLHLSGMMAEEKLSGDYADGIRRTWRQFVRYLWKNRICELPRNLDDADFRFVSVKKPIRTFSVANVAKLLKNCTPRVKLYSLLMLNCGLLNIDIAKLTPYSKHEEIGMKFDEGTLIWKRHKGRKKKRVPIVTYKLWPETLRLLKQEHEVSKTTLKKSGTKDTGVLLVNEDGNLLQTSKFVTDKNGIEKTRKTDAIKLAMRRGIADAGLKKNPRALRATASTMMDNHKDFGRYAQHFLGQAPTTIAGIHYVTPSQDQFDAALIWLGKQFGQA